MRPANSHLTNDEIDILLASAEPVEVSGASSDPREIKQHLAGCENCRTLLKLHTVAQHTLSNLKSDGSVSKLAGCPDDKVWTQVAANLPEEKEVAGYADHAAVCDYCGQQLREALHDLKDPLSVEETIQIAKLKASRPDWQNEMAEKMALMAAGRPPMEPPARKPFLFPYKWAFAAGLLAVVILTIVWRVHTNRSFKPPDDMLAEAYSERRTLELRFGTARHAHIHEERGEGAKSSIDRPQPLIDAEAIISRGLKSHPDDPAWLQAKGRADLLAWNYDSAIRSFKQALDHNPDSPELQTDLASAFFERAEATGQHLDFGTALELLGRALASQPDNVVALFNHAIIAERMHLYEQSIQDWERYLRLDANGEWATEAREHLQKIQKKNSMM